MRRSARRLTRGLARGLGLAVLALALLAGGPARADSLVLVHGYLGSPASWSSSGVEAVLSAQGWAPAGILWAAPDGVRAVSAPGVGATHRAYAVSLPSMAPLMVQADQLTAMLKFVERRHPYEPIVIVGHSAGGVVARLALVRGGAGATTTLITIASPHLGTVRAVQALDGTDDPWPVTWAKAFLIGEGYDVLRASRGLLSDLVPARPGSLLYWLNAQPHPNLRYVSILRGGPVGLGDEMVPLPSQDMNQVQALAGRSQSVVVASDHSLYPGDGLAVARLLARGEQPR